MARIDIGNELTEPVLQPGYSIQSDGFGLNTCTANFKVNGDYVSELNIRGTSFPVSTFNYLKAHKETVTFDALGIATIKVDYVGIEPSINGGVRTNPNTSVANGLTTENITSHPNFFTVQAGYPAAIAGTTYEQSDKGPTVTTVTGAPTKSFVGLNGACFERATGGRFIGFVDPAYPAYFGKTNYLSTTTTYSGVMYSSAVTDVQALMALLNTATSTNSWGVFNLIPDWAPVGTGDNGNKNLLSQVNVEEFGLLYKINYEIRYSKVGWKNTTYINID